MQGSSELASTPPGDSVVSVVLEDGLAIVSINNPPVNAGNARVRTALHRELTALSGNRADVEAVMLRGEGTHFVAGSDVSEFDGPIAEPSLPQVIAVIDAMPVPVIAALKGLTLGGGLELAMACDVRIAASDARMGLPEVTLGIVPGAGGTVLLPRLVGVPEAIRMISTGDIIDAQHADRIGLVDQVVEPGQLESSARVTARRAVKRRARDAAASTRSSPEEIDAAREVVWRDPQARLNVHIAVDLVISGAQKPYERALSAERQAFNDLRTSSDASNLRYLFFAKRTAAKDLPRSTGARGIDVIGIAGAGTMGSKIAATALRAGYSVVLYELNESARARAEQFLRAERSAPMADDRLLITDLPSDLGRADLFIDAVFEDMGVKRDLLTAIEPLLRRDALIASNTSYLDLDELGASLRHPDRFVGAHFFNPADRNPLLEVIRTQWTDELVLAGMSAFAKRLNKTTILAGVGEGFVANRVYADYRMQAEFLVEDGSSPRDVDNAMVAFGLRIGPFAVADMSGLDIAWARRKRLAAEAPPVGRYVTIADSLCEAGRFGKKTSAGWYRYSAAAPRGEDDPVVAAIVDDARAAHGISPRAISASEIQQRLVSAICVAAAEIVDSGVAQRGSDVDLAFTEGFGFPRWSGGPVRFAASQPKEWVEEGMDRLRSSDPVGYAKAFHEGLAIPTTVQSLLAAVRPMDRQDETPRLERAASAQ